MATYQYETTTKPKRRFEIKQSMNDPALKVHPETGQPVKRIITGGFGFRPLRDKPAMLRPEDYKDSKFAPGNIPKGS